MILIQIEQFRDAWILGQSLVQVILQFESMGLAGETHRLWHLQGLGMEELHQKCFGLGDILIHFKFLMTRMPFSTGLNPIVYDHVLKSKLGTSRFKVIMYMTLNPLCTV